MKGFYHVLPVLAAFARTVPSGSKKKVAYEIAPSEPSTTMMETLCRESPECRWRVYEEELTPGLNWLTFQHRPAGKNYTHEFSIPCEFDEDRPLVYQTGVGIAEDFHKRLKDIGAQ